MSVARLSLPQSPAITKVKIRQLWSRMRRVLRFNSGVYLELRNDETATGQSIATLFIASLGYAIGYSFLFLPFEPYILVVSITARLILSLSAGLVWALVAFFLGTKLFKGSAKFWQVARPLFFSVTPGIFFVLMGISVEQVYRPVAAIVATWIVVGGVVALKNSMGFSYNRSMLIYIVGFLGFIVLGGFSRQ